MRVLQVSAHYPPDFVSGGTLQPQRVARGLRDRGHEVAVLAGNLDPTRPPLERWDEVDDTGLPVTWVATAPFVPWSDERNYDNPGVTAIAADTLDRFAPDLVHCHSLQTLGVGPIDVAADRGIPVVVTMHDFWWLCARQFLVDQQVHPCTLVVDVSECPCDAGRAHLDQRRRRLDAALERVTQILVPSQIAADVLIANGVDPGRLAVDENGVPAGDEHTAPLPGPRPPDGTVTVRYTGGSSPLKGADVLLDAVDRAGPLTQVRVVAHDLAGALARRRADPATCGIELAPAYGPDELDTVLADTDVLLLPSVMRETFSIVTREALLRGVPVVATDSLGPEEVIVDHQNGLILPAGDAGALADLLRAIDADPAIAARWRRRIGPVHLRSVDDQVRDLEARYQDLLDRTDPAASGAADRAAAPATSRAVLFVVGIDGAPLRYRAQLPAEALAMYGSRALVRHHTDPDLAEVGRWATHVVVYRVPASPRILDLIATWRAAGTPVAFDVDDLIFDPDIAAEIPALTLLDPADAALWLEGVRRYRTTMEACDAFIGSTPKLVEHAHSVTGMPAHLFGNGVGRELAILSDRARARPRAPGPLRVGYLSGTSTHDDDWRLVAPNVLAALADRPDVELWLGGHLTVDDELAATLGPRLRRLPFMAWTELPGVLRDLDVNLAPLDSGRFNEAKSAIKWLEAALVETPTIASPTGPFTAAIHSGFTGLLPHDGVPWEKGIGLLLDDDTRRARIGRAARRAALLHWSPAQQGRRYLAVLDEVAVARRAGRAPDPAWVPEVREEPVAPAPVLLDAYPSANGSVRPVAGPLAQRLDQLRAGRVATGARRVRSSYRDEGLAATGRRIVRTVARRSRARLNGRER